MVWVRARCCFSDGGAEFERWCHAPCLIATRQVISSDSNSSRWFFTGPCRFQDNEQHYCVVPHQYDNAHAQIPTLFAKCNVSLNTSSFSLFSFHHKAEMFRQSLNPERILSHTGWFQTSALSLRTSECCNAASRLPWARVRGIISLSAIWWSASWKLPLLSDSEKYLSYMDTVCT